MNYNDWVRNELRELSKSLGFRYTPPGEIEGRLKRVRTGMEKEGSAGFENTVVVTEKGCEILTPLEEEIFEV
jgi:methionine aminopeptidase